MSYRRLTRVIGALLLGSLGCAHTSAVLPDDTPGDYRLGSADVIDVSVWKEPALSATVVVRPDGKCSLPMVGEILASGRTAEELRRELGERLRPFVSEPVVSVMVKEIHASRFFVLGEVAHPGVFPLSPAATVLEAISMAGGTTEFARKRHIVVIRRDGSRRSMRLPVDFLSVISGRAQAVTLKPGDTVYVP